MKNRFFMLSAIAAGVPAISSAAAPLNILLITADDLGIEALECFGGKPAGLTPNLNRFAAEGMRFYHAHVNAAICQPSRTIIGTGLYSHRSGAMGFVNARNDVPSVIELFKNAGYKTGVLGKVGHSTPNNRADWDYDFDQKELGNGRSPSLYYQRSKTFFEQCRKENRPFYFMVNSHDPHRPFHIPGDVLKGGAENPSRLYTPEDAAIPGFLPDLPDVRKEYSYYMNSVRRLDDTFGKIMQALDESGYAGNTLVVFLSDNGSSFPFAKCNVYVASSRTPWIVRWPGVVSPGAVDKDHFISGIDFLPTALEAAGISHPGTTDGFSIVPLLKGESQSGRESVFTQIDRQASSEAFPMRCVQNKKFAYIFNGWSDGKCEYSNNNEGMTMKAMTAAAQNNSEIAGRIQMFRYRTPDEFYNLEKDPDCITNLVNHPEYKTELARLKKEMRNWMQRTGDPLLELFDSQDGVNKSGLIEKIYGTSDDFMKLKKERSKGLQ